MLLAPEPSPAWSAGTLATLSRPSEAFSTPVATPATSRPGTKRHGAAASSTPQSISWPAAIDDEGDAHPGAAGPVVREPPSGDRGDDARSGPRQHQPRRRGRRQPQGEPGEPGHVGEQGDDAGPGGQRRRGWRPRTPAGGTGRGRSSRGRSAARRPRTPLSRSRRRRRSRPSVTGSVQPGAALGQTGQQGARARRRASRTPGTSSRARCGDRDSEHPVAVTASRTPATATTT